MAAALSATLVMSTASFAPVQAAAAGTTASAAAAAPAATAAPATSAAAPPAAGTAPATSTAAPAAPPPLPTTVPAAPYGLNPSHNLAALTTPPTGYTAVQLQGATTIDQAAQPLAVLQQRTYGTTLAQWQAQGAQPVSPNVQVKIDPTKYQNVQMEAAPPDTATTSSTAAQPSVQVYAAGALDGNTASALAWPATVGSVDFPFHVSQTGLYQLSVTYYDYPNCMSSSGQTLADITGAETAANSVEGPYCGRESSAERGVLIDPPNTVPTVQAAAQALTACQQAIVNAAEASGIAQSSLPGWIDPSKDFLLAPPSPAWAIVPQPSAAAAQGAASAADCGITSASATGAASGTSATPAGSATSGTAATPAGPATSGTSAAGTAAAGTSATPAGSATSGTAAGASSTAAATAASAPAAAPALAPVATAPTPACALDLNDSADQNEGYNGYEYSEAEQVPFTEQWQETGTSVNPQTGYVSFQKDNRGDDLYPIPQEAETWQTTNVVDALATYQNPLQFCLSAGDHVLRLAMVSEPMAIEAISFHGADVAPTYSQALTQWQAQGMQPVTCGMCLEVQGENIYQMSDPTIEPGSDSYPSIVPATHGYTILNDLNGQYWQTPNQWVEYQITVPQTGLYKLGLKVLQAGLQGLPAGRDLTIDGQTPFDGAQWVSLPFANSWNVVTLSQPNGQPALLGLTKGTHILRLRVTLGLVGQTLTQIQQAGQRLDELEREILMVTGSNPQAGVTYNLAQNVNGLVPQMQSIVSVLHQQAQLLTYAAGGRPPVAANSINITANDIADLAAHTQQIQVNMTRWENDAQALAQWLTLLEAQPVSVDFFTLTSPSYKLPSPSASVVRSVAVAWQTFILSFYRDYTGVGSVYSNAINVWVGYGQLWAALMSQLAASYFTPVTHVNVNFNVVPGGAGIVLLAQVSGHGPDVATGMPATAPVDFALRDGAYDLSTFPNWSNIASRFVSGASVPYQFTDSSGHSGIYGVPESQGMTIMIYRKDILATLDSGRPVPVPSTWNELYQILPLLNSKGMEFYYPPGPTGALPFLYQNGGSYYTGNPTTPGGVQSNLETDSAYQAIKNWTDLFTEWKVPLSANFFTRFQTGETPIGVADYPTYVQLNVAAPQLAGLWGIAPIPGEPYQCDASGCVDSNTATAPQPACEFPDLAALGEEPALPAGMTCEINHTSGDNGTSNAIIIPKSSKHANEAWLFVEWWTSAATQLRFANDIIAVAGVQAAWNTANVEALQGLPWPQQDLETFQQVWSQYQPEPVVPGGYVADRYINNVWTNVVINGENVRAQLAWATQNIDDELYRQEVQYGLTQAQSGRIAVGA